MRFHNEVHRVIVVVIAANRVRQQRFGLGIARVVLREIWPALAVGFHLRAHDAEASAFPIQILDVARAWAVRDDALDIPFIRVEQESNKRLLVIGVAARIGLNDQAQTRLGVRLVQTFIWTAIRRRRQVGRGNHFERNPPGDEKCRYQSTEFGCKRRFHSRQALPRS
jgi:hypothetical protein